MNEEAISLIPIPESVGYKRAVGQVNNWDIFGQHQFDVMVSYGLLPSHSLLEVGCGSLRAGRFFISYLDTSNYYGVEPNVWLVNAGIENHIEDAVIASKRPTFSPSPDFDFDFGCTFDRILVHSIFCHAALWQVELCLSNAASVLSGQLYATFQPADRNDRSQSWNYPRNVGYTLNTIQSIAEDAGFIFDLLSIEHPSNKLWFRCEREYDRDILL